MPIIGLQAGVALALQAVGSISGGGVSRKRDAAGGFDPGAPAGTPPPPATRPPSHQRQALASDIQAILLQARTDAGASSDASPASAAAEQKLADDLRAFIDKAESGGRTASANPTDPAAVRHHHRHHHRGGEANAASAVAQFNGAASASGGAHGDRTVSRVLAGEIAHALRAYGAAAVSASSSSSS